MALISAIACIVEIQGLLYVNQSPPGVFDKLDGTLGVYSNEILRDLRINASIIGVDDLGTCDPATRKCTGVRGLLESGTADFSLTMIEKTGLDADYCYPHEYGPVLQASETFILQMPDQGASAYTAGVFNLIMDISPICIGILAMFDFAALLLINLRLDTSGIYIMKHYSLLDVWRHMMNHPHKSFRSIPRRITIMFMLLLQLWTYQTMMATAKGDLTIVTPAVYLKTLAEIADSNRSVYVNPGTVTDIHFSTSHHPTEVKIRKKLVRSNKSPIIASIPMKSELTHLKETCGRNKCQEEIRALQQKYDSLSKAICFHDDSVSACNYAGWICHMNDYKKNIDYRFTRYILPNQNFGRTFGLSRNISNELRSRISFTLFALYEHGFTMQPMAPSRVIDPDGVLHPGKMISCFDRVLSTRSARNEQVHDLPLSAYDTFFITISACFTICFLAFLCEKRLCFISHV